MTKNGGLDCLVDVSRNYEIFGEGKHHVNFSEWN